MSYQDLPAEQFQQLVELLLAYWKQEHGLSEAEAEHLRADAKSMKSAPHLTDRDVLSRLVRDVISPGPVGAESDA